MIDRAPPRSDGVERDDLVAERAAELGERVRCVRGERQAYAMRLRAIEHEAAGAFEKLAAGLEAREIDDALDPIAVLVDAARRGAPAGARGGDSAASSG